MDKSENIHDDSGNDRNSRPEDEEEDNEESSNAQYGIVRERRGMPLRMIVNSRFMGAIIGQGGCNIKHIGRETNTLCLAGDMIDVGGMPSFMQQIINIYGPPENCTDACMRILVFVLQIREGSRYQYPDRDLKLRVHDNLIGRLIGKDGNNLQRIMEETDCHIFVSSVDLMGPNDIDRTLTIRGRLEKIPLAERMISDQLRHWWDLDRANGIILDPSDAHPPMPDGPRGRPPPGPPSYGRPHFGPARPYPYPPLEHGSFPRYEIPPRFQQGPPSRFEFPPTHHERPPRKYVPLSAHHSQPGAQARTTYAAVAEPGHLSDYSSPLVSLKSSTPVYTRRTPAAVESSDSDPDIVSYEEVNREEEASHGHTDAAIQTEDTDLVENHTENDPGHPEQVELVHEQIEPVQPQENCTSTAVISKHRRPVKTEQAEDSDNSPPMTPIPTPLLDVRARGLTPASLAYEIVYIWIPGRLAPDLIGPECANLTAMARQSGAMICIEKTDGENGPDDEPEDGNVERSITIVGPYNEQFDAQLAVYLYMCEKLHQTLDELCLSVEFKVPYQVVPELMEYAELFGEASRTQIQILAEDAGMSMARLFANFNQLQAVQCFVRQLIHECYSRDHPKATVYHQTQDAAMKGDTEKYDQ